jgi:hypothetical protein
MPAGICRNSIRSIDTRCSWGCELNVLEAFLGFCGGSCGLRLQASQYIQNPKCLALCRLGTAKSKSFKQSCTFIHLSVVCYTKWSFPGFCVSPFAWLGARCCLLCARGLAALPCAGPLSFIRMRSPYIYTHAFKQGGVNILKHVCGLL